MLLFFWQIGTFSREVAAHPGGTAGDGCHFCRTNCAKYGEVQDQRHCHNAKSSPAPVKFSAPPPPPKTPRTTVFPTAVPPTTVPPTTVPPDTIAPKKPVLQLRQIRSSAEEAILVVNAEAHSRVRIIRIATEETREVFTAIATGEEQEFRVSLPSPAMWEFFATAQDRAGNTSKAALLQLDTQLVENMHIDLLSPPGESDAVLQVEGTSPTSSLVVREKDVILAEIRQQSEIAKIHLKGLSDGNHALLISGTDQYGRPLPETTYEVVVDTTPPTILITLDKEQSKAGVFAYIISSNEDAHVRVESASPKLAAIFSIRAGKALSIGKEVENSKEHEIRVRVADIYDNESVQTARQLIELPQERPIKFVAGIFATGVVGAGVLGIGAGVLGIRKGRLSSMKKPPTESTG